MKKKKKQTSPNFLRVAFFWMLVFLGIIWLVQIFNMGISARLDKLSYNDFYSLVEKNLERPTIERVKKSENLIQGEYTKEYAQEINKDYFQLYIPQEDKEIITLLRKNVQRFDIEPPKSIWTNLLYSLGWMLPFILFLWYFSYKGSQVGSRVWSFGRARAQLIEKGKAPKVTFRDVAGIDEAKEELREVIEFVKDPKRFQ
ncbi:MAG: cell division protein FtsH, partial [Candidatus Omnitrophota bacterium]